MAATAADKIDHRLQDRGVGSIHVNKGLRILDLLFDYPLPQVGVVPINWSKFVWSFGGPGNVPRFFSDIVEKQAIESKGLPEPGLAKTALLEADPVDRQGLLELYLAAQVAGELKIPLHELDISQSLAKFGFDSLMAVTVRNRIELDLGITLPMVKLVEGHSVSVLATLMCDQLHTHSYNGSFDRKATLRRTEESIQFEGTRTNIPAIDLKQEEEGWEEGTL
jgi:acyl carrier protein